MSIFKLDINYKNLAIIALALFSLVLIYKIQEIISVFAISFFIAYLLDPIIDKLESFKIPRTLGIVILMVITLSIAIVISAYLLPLLYSEIEYLTKAAPEVINSLMDMVEKLATRFNTDVSMANIKAQFAPKAGAIAKELFSALTGVLSSASGAIGTVVNLAIIPILVFYFLKDFDRMNEKLFKIMENKSDTDYKRYFKDFDSIL
ncbi:MAG: hypothetical protein C0603_08920 [Denitrovibrio sp.]|nr:MAG: hypothetical protein C0603_08920 [Denitrovibrio sp.]